MSAQSRTYILRRRGAGIADLSTVTMTSGDATLDEAEKMGLYKINCTHQIGIATSTEVGLTVDRYPIRVVLADDSRLAMEVETCARYWSIYNAALQPVIFSRKPIASAGVLKNFYDAFPTIDASMWKAWDLVKNANPVVELFPELAEVQKKLSDLLAVVTLTADQKLEINKLQKTIMNECVRAKKIPYYQLSPDNYLICKPHGIEYSAQGSVRANRVALNETVLCVQANFNKLKARYPNIPEGTILAASTSVANMFRYGFYESYEHTEYVTVTATPVVGTTDKFTVTKLDAPEGYVSPSHIAIGATLDLAGVKVTTKLGEYATLLVWTSGLMHYLFNHTTGGSQMSGALLTTLSMYGHVSADTSSETVTDLTSLFYECLHPTNKRAIANLFFPNSKVYTHGRSRGAPRYEPFTLDAFTQIRGNPYPAGSHKAYVCLMALKRVLTAGFAPFLPWNDELTTCINLCREILNSGAKAHIGAGYYTGEPPTTQPSSIDHYLPELAYFIQTFSKMDSLAMSPHMSAEVASRSSVSWMSLMKDCKAKDISGAKAEQVQAFLATQGTVAFKLDLEDQTTWATAGATARDALAIIEGTFA